MILKKIIQFFKSEPIQCDTCFNKRCTHTPSICDECVDYNEYEEDVSHEILKGESVWLKRS